MLAPDHFDFSGHAVDHHQQPLRYAHGRRMVLHTFSRLARKTGCDHDEPDGTISAGYPGTGQRDFSGSAMPVHSESKESGLSGCQIFASAALPHLGNRGSAGRCHGGQMLFTGKHSSIGVKVRQIRLVCPDRNYRVLRPDDMLMKIDESDFHASSSSLFHCRS